ncbi:MAG: hypothetical protein M5U12_21610 [Verrucomicrobia bacterium]|nr:hypothetical protein [Verrucomicrobiota bacterium]
MISAAGNYQGMQRSFLYPAGTDLAPLLGRGQAVLFAWDPGQSPCNSRSPVSTRHAKPATPCTGSPCR